MTAQNTAISLNRLAKPLVESLVRDAETLRLVITRHANGCRIIDAGITCIGGIEAGRRIAEICMGALGRVTVVPYGLDSSNQPAPAFAIMVESSQPVLACLGSQYAGWTLSGDEFYALGSGPARALWAGEELFSELGYHDRDNFAVLVIETDKIPPDSVIAEIAAKARVEAEDLTLILTPTTSLAGGVQIVARSLEVALHKAHSLHYPLNQIIDGVAVAPLPPPCSDFMTAMGRTNDAILYGATVQLFVSGSSDTARDLADRMPSNTSRDYGRGFATIFADYNHDFYKIDPLLFSPARIVVTAVTGGQSFHRGSLNPAVLRQSFELS